MNREIKFRAWDKEKNMMYFPTFYIRSRGGVTNMTSADMNERLEVMQFTGLKDKNGKEIYEGDMLRRNCPDPNCKGIHKGEVFYRDDVLQFVFRNHEDKSDSPVLMESELGFSAPLEVIGNIFENPELLK